MTARIASSRWPLLTAIFLALALAAVLIPTTVGAGQESTALITVFESGGISERTADGIADTLIAVRLDGDIVAASDDESIGLFGTGSQLRFVAPNTATYELEIGTFDDTRWGYLLQVDIE